MNFSNLLSQLYRFTRAVLFIACVLAMSIILLGRLLVPHATTLTPQLTRYLEANTELDWKIEGLSGEWQHLKPIIRIESISAHVNYNQSLPSIPSHDSLIIKKAELQVDLVASLINLEWRVRQLKASHIQLPLRYSKRLGWHVDGLEFSPNKITHQKNTFNWIGFYQHLQVVDVSEFEWLMLTDIGDQNTRRQQSNIMSLLFQAADDSRQLEVRQATETEQASITLLSQGEIGQQDFQFDAHIYANKLNLSPWLSIFDERRFDAFQTDRWTGQLWFKKAIDQDWQATMVINDGSLTSKNELRTLDNISFRAGFSFNPEHYLSLRWHDFTADWNQQRLSPSSAELALKGAVKKWHSVMIRSPFLDIDQLSLLVTDQHWMPEKPYKLIKALNPSGRLRQAEFLLPLDGKFNFSGKAILEDFDLSAWKSVPGLQQANIYLEASKNKGLVQISNESRLSVFFLRFISSHSYFHGLKRKLIGLLSINACC